MKRTIIQSFIMSLSICGCLILLNFMCPFLNIKTDPISYTHSFGGIVIDYDSYNEIKYIGIFGVDNIIGTEEHFNEVSDYYNINKNNPNDLHDYYSNTNKENYQYKKLNWITISIEFTIIFIILFIIFHKQHKNLYSIYSDDI